MSLTFKGDLNVFDDDEFVGRIETENGFQPVFYAVTENHISINDFQEILDKMRELDY